MQALKVLLVLAVLAGASAQYVQIDSYISSGCSGTPLLSSFYQSGVCIVLAGSSVQITISGSSATYAIFSNGACTGTAGTSIAISASGSCTSLGKVTFPVSGSWVNAYAYSDASCGTLISGPSSYPVGMCYNGFEYQAGHTLSICSGCTSSAAGTCQDTGVTSGQCLSASGQSGSVKYVFSAATRVPPVAGLVAVLMAAAVAVAKFL
jgi:hypothetical protein